MTEVSEQTRRFSVYLEMRHLDHQLEVQHVVFSEFIDKLVVVAPSQTMGASCCTCLISDLSLMCESLFSVIPQ